jgi:hypothetical protein
VVANDFVGDEIEGQAVGTAGVPPRLTGPVTGGDRVEKPPGFRRAAVPDKEPAAKTAGVTGIRFFKKSSGAESPSDRPGGLSHIRIGYDCLCNLLVERQ